TILGAILVFRDVTERRRAAEAQLHLSAVVDSSDDAIVSKNLDGIVSSWNEGAQRIFGYSSQEVIGKPVEILLPPDRQHEEEDILRRLRRGERLDHFETIRIHKDGHPIDVSVTASLIRDSVGRIIGASMIARDITHRKRTEKTARFLADGSAALADLSDDERTLRKLASLAVPFFADWCVVDMQEPDGAVRRLAVAPEGAALEPAADNGGPRPPSPQPGHLGTLKVLRTCEPIWAPNLTDSTLTELAGNNEELRLIRSLGFKSYLCVPLHTRTRAIGTITFAMAKSGRTFSEDDLQVAKDLAHRAVIAIENASLLAALRESDHRKDEFLAMVAHELRNPLAPISNAVQILRAKAPPPAVLQWATEVIDRQVLQMTRLVDDLLDVSRITSGKIQLNREKVQLAEVVSSAVDASRPLIEKCGHEFTVEMPQEPILLEADLTRLSQVLLNLLNNAAKYTNPGGRIWLTVRQEGANAVIRVKDTGIGISDEMLPRIFEMFTQVDRSLERSQGGLGIGLMLVQRLVGLHGGTVHAHSEGPGKGSEFEVRLPIAAGVEERRGVEAGPEDEARGVAVRRRVLVVDDNRDSATSLAVLLQMAGNDVRTAHDGLEAIAVAEEFQPDTVLLDIGLPKLNGYAAARRIRDDRGDGVVLIAVTGWGQKEDRRRSSEAGFDHHLTKPVDLGTLYRLLANSPRTSARENPTPHPSG
ncbi:MAG: PAS domain S-box protein, partial [Candidatus Eisenbacteria bacterium]